MIQGIHPCLPVIYIKIQFIGRRKLIHSKTKKSKDEQLSNVLKPAITIRSRQHETSGKNMKQENYATNPLVRSENKSQKRYCTNQKSRIFPLFSDQDCNESQTSPNTHAEHDAMIVLLNVKIKELEKRITSQQADLQILLKQKIEMEQQINQLQEMNSNLVKMVKGSQIIIQVIYFRVFYL